MFPVCTVVRKVVVQSVQSTNEYKVQKRVWWWWWSRCVPVRYYVLLVVVDNLRQQPQAIFQISIYFLLMFNNNIQHTVPSCVHAGIHRTHETKLHR